ncbi:MAG: hypothetical protein RL651_206 [Pseudomonadota bacterium]|jgi:hypothetical protein
MFVPNIKASFIVKDCAFFDLDQKDRYIIKINVDGVFNEWKVLRSQGLQLKVFDWGRHR